MSDSNYDLEVDIEMKPEPATSNSSDGFMQRWKREDWLKRSVLGLRGVALFFSLLSFLLMASNNHGQHGYDWESFAHYSEYRYLVAVAIFSSLYTGGQVYRQFHELLTGNNLFQPTTAALVDFIGDQVMAYLLISAASTAIPITDRLREGGDNIFTDSSAATITMCFFAFIFLAFSAISSGYKLSVQTYT